MADNTESLTLRIPRKVKVRLERTGNVSRAVREALERWVMAEDRADRKAKQELAEKGLLEIVRICNITAPRHAGEDVADWAERCGIPSDPEIVAALERIT